MEKEELNLFSDNLPVRLPVWHSVQSANKKFSMFNNQFDFDIIPDYGGHMLNFNKKTGKFKSIKNDQLGKSPFAIKSHAIPIKINLESTRDEQVLNANKINECLVYDQNLNLLISTLSYDHPSNKELVIKKIDQDEEQQQINDNKNTLREHFYLENGNLEQVNRFTNTGTKIITNVRQEKCITVLELKEDQLIKRNMIKIFDLNENYFYSDYNTKLYNSILSGSNVDSKINLNEVNIERNVKVWSSLFQFATGKPLEVKYSEYHPKMAYYASSNEISLFDTRFKACDGSLKVSKTNLSSISGIEKFRRISNSITNPNYLFVTSDFSLMLFDIRYPNYILLQWNHMLSSDTNVCFLKNFKLEKESLFIANREEISSISIDKPQTDNLLHPTSLHFPLHLPRLKSLIKNSNVTDLRLEDYIDRMKIVGLDFAFRNENDFDLYLMNQYGDIFRQKLSKTKLKEDETFLQYESNDALNENLKLFKERLEKRRLEAGKYEDFFSSIKNDLGELKLKKPKDTKYWLQFADNLKLDDDNKIKQEMNEQKEELGK